MAKYPAEFPMAEATELFGIVTAKQLAERRVDAVRDAWWIAGYVASVAVKDGVTPEPGPDPKPVFSTGEPTAEDAALLDLQNALAELPECQCNRPDGYAATAGKPDLEFLLKMVMQLLPVLLAL